MTSINMSRRTFVASAGSLTICFSLGAQEAFADALIDQMNGAVRSVAPENLDSWLSIANDGAITLFTGRVDLGTGTQAVFAQFVAEEMDVPVGRVNVIMGDTRLTPNQGKTTASLNVVRGSQPIRVAAAEARAALLRMASERTSVPAADLEVSDGIVRSKSTPSTSISYGELIGGRNFSITLEAQAKDAEDIARGIMLKPKAPLKAMKDFKVPGNAARASRSSAHIRREVALC
jgi:nicotinate dehydrogenase subunit B